MPAPAASRPDVVPLGPERSDLGESPVWDAERDRLLWVDMLAGLVHSRSGSLPTADTAQHWSLGERVSMVTPSADGRLLCALGPGLAILDEDGQVSRQAALVDAAATPLNDGIVDAHGTAWVGTFDLAGGGRAGVWRQRPDQPALQVLQQGLDGPNGMGVSPDGETIYLVESIRRVVLAWQASDPDPVPRVVVDLQDAPGMPDGLAVDRDGFLWVALVGAGELRRYGPEGRLERRWALPTSRPTNLAFGGPGLDVVHVTTARVRLEAAELAAQPLAGSVLVTNAPVPGLPTAAWGSGTRPAKDA